jgi:hypothetical protein
LKNKKYICMLHEKTGLMWKLSKESRWEFEQYCSKFTNSDDIVRISVSFRFFQNEKQIPVRKITEQV